MRPKIFKSSLALLCLLFTSCATQRIHDEGIAAFQRGDYEDGISKLTQASQHEPDNLAYRLDLRSAQEAAVQKLIALADDAHAHGRPELAEADYRRVLILDPSNDRAHHGLDQLVADRRHIERIAHAEAELNAKQLEAADADVHAVLSEDPVFAPAVALATRIGQARGPITVVPRLRTHDNHPVTLQFRDAQTKMVFEVLARQTGINFIFDKDVKSDGKTTIFVSEVPVEEAIELILTQNQLARQILSENMVLVYPNTPAKQKDYQDEVVHTFYLANAVPKDAESMLKTVLAAKTMYVDERSNALTIRDTPEHVRMAEKLINSLDEPEPEVIMEVEVLEISHSMAQQLGIDYPTSVTLAPTAVTAAAAGSSASQLVLGDLSKQNKNTITISSLSATVDLLKTVGDTNVLSSPRIRARNKEKAKILVGDRVPVITSGTSATTGGTYSTSSVQYLDVGLTLEVQPTIHLDGEVAIKVALEVSSIANTINVPIGNGGTTLAYQISTRNANTLLQLKDGETQVLAGLIQDSDSRSSNHIPGLGDLPVLGRLFGSNHTARDKSEIVLAITPRIIRAQPRPDSDNTEFWYGTESQTRSAPFMSQTAMSGGGAGAAAVAPSGAGAMPPGGVSFAGNASATTAPVSSGPRAVPSMIASNAGAPPPPPPPAPAATDTNATEAATAAARAPEVKSTDAKPHVTLEGPDTAKVGDEIDVAVHLTSGEPLGRVHTQVRFDPTALQLESAEPGDLVPSGETPKVDVRPGGVQLDLATGADAPISGGGSVVNMRFKVVAARPSSTIDTQVALLGEDGAVVAATAATPLKLAINP
jgi:general secretion pathway protein D